MAEANEAIRSSILEMAEDEWETHDKGVETVGFSEEEVRETLTSKNSDAPSGGAPPNIDSGDDGHSGSDDEGTPLVDQVRDILATDPTLGLADLHGKFPSYQVLDIQSALDAVKQERGSSSDRALEALQEKFSALSASFSGFMDSQNQLNARYAADLQQVSDNVVNEVAAITGRLDSLSNAAYGASTTAQSAKAEAEMNATALARIKAVVEGDNASPGLMHKFESVKKLAVQVPIALSVLLVLAGGITLFLFSSTFSKKIDEIAVAERRSAVIATTESEEAPVVSDQPSVQPVDGDPLSKF
jgi:hypothetical protein